MNARVTGGSAVATQAFTNLVQTSIPKLLSSSITKDLISYMALSDPTLIDSKYTGNYGGNVLTLPFDMGIDTINSTTTTNGQTTTSTVTTCNFDDYGTLLWYAGYVAWVNPKSAGITLQEVANLSAALAHYHLLQAFTAPSTFHKDVKTGPRTDTTTTKGTVTTRVVTTSTYTDFILGLDQIGQVCSSNTPAELFPGNDLAGLALAYDFSYSMMTPSQQEDVRKILFAVGYNRTSTSVYSRGFRQNGDFVNLGEYHIFLALAIAGEEPTVQMEDPDIYNEFSNASLFFDPNIPNWMTPPASALPSDPAVWPFANGANVSDLQREIW